MKKLFVLLLMFTVVCSLCSCSAATSNSASETTSEVDDGSIKLTADNYEKYIKSNGENCYPKGEYECVDVSGKKASLKLCDIVYASVTLNGLSTNFNYNDVKIVYKVTGCYERFTKKPEQLIEYVDLANGYIKYSDLATVEENFEFEVVVETDISGNGTGTFDYKIPNGYRVNGKDALKEYNIEVVSVSGTVTPA